MVPVSTATSAGAQDDEELHVEINPQRGNHGTKVVISGTGAPANAEVIVRVAVWTNSGNCSGPNEGETVATVTSDGEGQFSASHTADRLGDDQVCYMCFAYVPTGDAGRPMSNLEC